MIEEVLLAFVTSIPVTLMVFYGVGLRGSYVAFWICYYITLCNGIAVAYLVGWCLCRAAGAAARTRLSAAMQVGCRLGGLVEPARVQA